MQFDDIVPDGDWIRAQFPACVVDAMPLVEAKPPARSMSSIDMETVAQTYAHIVAGACFAMGVKFASSANRQAFETIVSTRL